MSVRAKFNVRSVTMYSNNFGEVELSAIHDTGTPENKRFTKATPNGTLKMGIDNPSALDQFKPGKIFYVDFTEANES